MTKTTSKEKNPNILSRLGQGTAKTLREGVQFVTETPKRIIENTAANLRTMPKALIASAAANSPLAGAMGLAWYDNVLGARGGNEHEKVVEQKLDVVAEKQEKTTDELKKINTTLTIQLAQQAAANDAQVASAKELSEVFLETADREGLKRKRNEEDAAEKNFNEVFDKGDDGLLKRVRGSEFNQKFGEDMSPFGKLQMLAYAAGIGTLIGTVIYDKIGQSDWFKSIADGIGDTVTWIRRIYNKLTFQDDPNEPQKTPVSNPVSSVSPDLVRKMFVEGTIKNDVGALTRISESGKHSFSAFNKDLGGGVSAGAYQFNQFGGSKKQNRVISKFLNSEKYGHYIDKFGELGKAFDDPELLSDKDTFDKLKTVWQTLSRDPKFRQAQMDFAEAEYAEPAAKRFKKKFGIEPGENMKSVLMSQADNAGVGTIDEILMSSKMPPKAEFLKLNDYEQAMSFQDVRSFMYGSGKLKSKANIPKRTRDENVILAAKMEIEKQKQLDRESLKRSSQTTTVGVTAGPTSSNTTYNEYNHWYEKDSVRDMVDASRRYGGI